MIDIINSILDQWESKNRAVTRSQVKVKHADSDNNIYTLRFMVNKRVVTIKAMPDTDGPDAWKIIKLA